jgi:prepilin peptidase CpaA
MRTAFLAVAVGIFAVAAYSDMLTRRIPNSLSLMIAALGLARITFDQDLLGAACTLAAGITIFAVTFALYRCGAIGGGDAKMIAAAALLTGYRELPEFLFLMSLCGGALAFATVAAAKLDPPLRRLWRAAHLPSNVEGERVRAVPKVSTVPYGVAIATAGVITLIAQR